MTDKELATLKETRDKELANMRKQAKEQYDSRIRTASILGELPPELMLLHAHNTMEYANHTAVYFTAESSDYALEVLGMLQLTRLHLVDFDALVWAVPEEIGLDMLSGPPAESHSTDKGLIDSRIVLCLRSEAHNRRTGMYEAWLEAWIKVEGLGHVLLCINVPDCPVNAKVEGNKMVFRRTDKAAELWPNYVNTGYQNDADRNHPNTICMFYKEEPKKEKE